MKLTINNVSAAKTRRWVLGVILSFTVPFNVTVFAQTVGTIGVGDINYAGPEQQLRSQENIISAVSDKFNSALLDTRKFTVLDYGQLEKRLLTQGLNLQGFYNKSYKGTELLQAGLDYILTADLVEFGLFEQVRGRSKSVVGLVDIDFKLLGVADETDGFESSVSAQARVKLAKDEAVDKDGVLDQAIDQAVDQLVDKVISTLHPIRVMKINEDNGVITLNYGRGLLQSGDTILVYPAEQKIERDASGEPVGESIATLQVINSEKKFATAQALDGFDRLEKGQKGQLLLTASKGY